MFVCFKLFLFLKEFQIFLFLFLNSFSPLDMFPNFYIFNTLWKFILFYGHGIKLQHHFVEKWFAAAAFNMAMPLIWHSIIVVLYFRFEVQKQLTSLLLFIFILYLPFFYFYFNWHIFFAFKQQNTVFYCILNN